MPQIFLKTASGALSGSTPDHSLTDFVNKVRESQSYSVNKCRLVQEAVFCRAVCFYVFVSEETFHFTLW